MSAAQHQQCQAAGLLAKACTGRGNASQQPRVVCRQHGLTAPGGLLAAPGTQSHAAPAPSAQCAHAHGFPLGANLRGAPSLAALLSMWTAGIHITRWPAGAQAARAAGEAERLAASRAGRPHSAGGGRPPRAIGTRSSGSCRSACPLRSAAGGCRWCRWPHATASPSAPPQPT